MVLGLAFGFCLLLDSCVSRVEVARVVNADGGLVATVTETNGGATTDFGYQVDIRRNWPVGWSERVAYFYGARRSDCAYGVNVRWIKNDTLLIGYMQAKSADVVNRTGIFGRSVNVVFKSGINDPSAPCGGVEYNLSR